MTFPVVAHGVVDSDDAAVAAAARLGYPVVLKTAHAGHPAQDRSAAACISISPTRRRCATRGAISRGVSARARIVARMMPRGVEIALGMIRDPQFGPLVTVGAGGVLIELLRRSARRTGAVRARRPRDVSSTGLQLRRLLDGYRGATRGRHRRVSRSRSAAFRCSPPTSPISSREIDVNPLVCGRDIARRRCALRCQAVKRSPWTSLFPPKTSRGRRGPRLSPKTVLFPHELELEMAGKLPRATKDALARAPCVEHGFNGINHAREVGGQGCTQLQQTLINEELGKATGALWAVVWHPAVPLKHGTRGADSRLPDAELPRRRRACVAVTEPDAGSDTAPRPDDAPMRRGDRYVIDGEKWFVTSGDDADYIIVHALVDGDPAKPTLFLVDSDTPGHPIKREPKFTHTYVFGHPEFLFEDVEVGADRVLGGVGEGLELTKDWFVEARLQIAANCLGAAIRAFELANDWAARAQSSSARRSAIIRRSSSCWPTWRSRSWRPRA